MTQEADALAVGYITMAKNTINELTFTAKKDN